MRMKRKLPFCFVLCPFIRIFANTIARTARRLSKCIAAKLSSNGSEGCSAGHRGTESSIQNSDRA